MAKYSRAISVSQIHTPLSLDYSFSRDNLEDRESAVIFGGLNFLPIVLALLAIGFFIVVRPRVVAGSISGDVEAAASIDGEESGFPANSSLTGVLGTESSPAPVVDRKDTVISPVFTPEVRYWDQKISEWSELYGLDPNVIATIMQIESCGDPSAASYAGAQGLFQVMPFHFAAGEDMLDPDTNAMRGLNFFNEQLRFTGGNVMLSFAGYNGGYAASGGDYDYWPNETQRYFRWAKGIYEEASAGLESSPTLSDWLAAGGAGGCQRAADRLGL